MSTHITSRATEDANSPDPSSSTAPCLTGATINFVGTQYMTRGDASNANNRLSKLVKLERNEKGEIKVIFNNSKLNSLRQLLSNVNLHNRGLRINNARKNRPLRQKVSNFFKRKPTKVAVINSMSELTNEQIKNGIRQLIGRLPINH